MEREAPHARCVEAMYWEPTLSGSRGVGNFTAVTQVQSIQYATEPLQLPIATVLVTLVSEQRQIELSRCLSMKVSERTSVSNDEATLPGWRAEHLQASLGSHARRVQCPIACYWASCTNSPATFRWRLNMFEPARGLQTRN